MCFNDMTYKDNSYVCLYPEGNKLLTFLDNQFKDFLKDSNFFEYHIPALIDGSVLKKCGYFTSFPHHLTAVAFIREEHYEEVANENSVRKEHVDICNKYLTPAACLHIYPMFEGKKVTENVAVTTKARVYRYEGERFEDITRLWDFTVRELVFIGNRDYVNQKLDEIKTKALEFALSITPLARLSNANDSFYPNKENEIKSKIQKANSLKFELLIPIKKKDVAVASFNFHELHFSKPFNFDDNNSIVTGCVGFGLERWIAACLEYGYKI